MILENQFLNFVGIYKVYTDGGEVSASTTLHTYTDTAGVSHTDTDGVIEVKSATSAYIVVTLGTDYELSSEIFATGQYNKNKPTASTTLEDAKKTKDHYRRQLYMHIVEQRQQEIDRWLNEEMEI